MAQLTHLHKYFDELQQRFGEPSLMPIYGAGEIHSPKAMFIFMNPTGRNVSAKPEWTGLRAPWIGTKNVWKMFNMIGLLCDEIYQSIQKLRPEGWTPEFSELVYTNLADNKVYITNLAKCTQLDSRPLKDAIFKNYLSLINDEIGQIKPKRLITFGNQVSSILIKKPISVSKYLSIDDYESISIKGLESQINVYPTFYPVGQGQRNLPKAVERIKYVLSI